MLSKGERIDMQNNKNSSDNNDFKIITKEEVLYVYVTLKELTIIIWEYIREKYLKRKDTDKPPNPQN
tara:strand:- start:909 stop:1109 length:201 start_codon:yes stop_codon:yes gene_type:complete